jgi:membrane-bound lytic murein transglycosylase D
MRRRLSTIGVLLLAMAIVLSGIAACTRSVEERGEQATEPPATEEVEVGPTGGETVVSAVTSTSEGETTATGEGATEASTPETPASPEPTETEEAVEPVMTPEPEETEEVASSEEVIVHTVRKGETLSEIAEQYGTTVKAIREANDIGSDNVIIGGQELEIPVSDEGSGDVSTSDSSGGESTSDSSSSESTSGSSSSESTSGCRIQHTVEKGEWVWQLAREYDVSPYDILDANDLSLKKANSIQPGQVL